MMQRLTASVYILVLLWSTLGHAQLPGQEAKRHFRMGFKLHWEEGNFEEALKHYRASYALQRNPDVWANIIFCLVDLREHVEAIAEFDAHVMSDWSALSELSRAQLQAYLLDVGRVMGFGLVSLDLPKPGAVFVDGQSRGQISGQIPLRILAGKHTLRVHVPGMADVEREIVAKPGEASRVMFTLRPLRPIEFSAGMVVGSSLGTNLERASQENHAIQPAPALGFMIGARLPFSFGKMFHGDVALDYLQVHASLPGRETWFGTPINRDSVQFKMEHGIALYGTVLHAGLGLRAHITPTMDLTLRAGIGGFFGAYVETGKGEVFRGVERGEPAEILTGAQFLFWPLVLPEIFLSTQAGPVRIGISFGMLLAPFASTRVNAPYADATGDDCKVGTSCTVSRLRLETAAVQGRRIEQLVLMTPSLRLEVRR